MARRLERVKSGNAVMVNALLMISSNSFVAFLNVR